MSDELHPNSLLAHGGGGFDSATGGVVPSIQPSTTFVRDEDYELVSGGHLYSRDDNDLYRKTEGLIASLEGAEDSRLFASGMAAVAAVVRTVRPGGTILMQSGIYWGTTVFVRKTCARTGIKLIEADAAEPDVFDAEIARLRPDLVFLEVPSNPFLQVADISRASDAAKASGAVLAVDATAATPLILKPIRFGADLVVHSATKALNGHSDLLGGVVSTADRNSEAWDFITAERHDAGAVLGSFETWLLLRGLRTLGLRVERMNANAQALAEYLAAHPKIERVLYPGLESQPDHSVAKAQMTGGYGSLMSILIESGREDALKVTGALKLFQRATSLGGVESLVEHRYTIEGAESGIPPTLLRLSIGIEHIDDLKADFEQALATI
jgi:cystathionine gamma-synthase